MCVHICEPSLIKHPKGILQATEEKRFGEGTAAAALGGRRESCEPQSNPITFYRNLKH